GPVRLKKCGLDPKAMETFPDPVGQFPVPEISNFTPAGKQNCLYGVTISFMSASTTEPVNILVSWIAEVLFPTRVVILEVPAGVVATVRENELPWSSETESAPLEENANLCVMDLPCGLPEKRRAGMEREVFQMDRGCEGWEVEGPAGQG
ncbi:MAG TPA: hypothetical protein VGR56_04650, partial [Nitrososphaerales archaeon]|nr:hypothetical protein [Nitrososphaerales archaeon]